MHTASTTLGNALDAPNRARPSPTRPATIGVAAGLAAAMIWGGALAMTRLGVTGNAALGPADIALLRFTVPAVVLLPVLIRALPQLRRTSLWLLAVLLAGGGTPFVLVAGNGLSLAGAAEAGALLPAMVPLCVAVASALMGERFNAMRRAGLVLIAAAVALVAVPPALSVAQDSYAGHLLLLVAAVLSAAYTLALRRSGFGPWEAAAFVSAGSVVCLWPCYAIMLEPAIFIAPSHDVLLQASFQGLASGLLAPIAFAVAVARIGASRAAAFGCLSPGAATLAGFVLMGEVPDGTTMVAVALSSVGVALLVRNG